MELMRKKLLDFVYHPMQSNTLRKLLNTVANENINHIYNTIFNKLRVCCRWMRRVDVQMYNCIHFIVDLSSLFVGWLIYLVHCPSSIMCIIIIRPWIRPPWTAIQEKWKLKPKTLLFSANFSIFFIHKFKVNFCL